MAAEENSWRTPAFRQSVISKIDEAIQRSGMPTSKNSGEMENHVYQKAKSKEEYLGFVARLILHIREMNSKKAAGMGAGGQAVQDPLNALHTLARQGTSNSQMISLPPQGAGMVPQPPPPITATNLLQTLNQRPGQGLSALQSLQSKMPEMGMGPGAGKKAPFQTTGGAGRSIALDGPSEKSRAIITSQAEGLPANFDFDKDFESDLEMSLPVEACIGDTANSDADDPAACKSHTESSPAMLRQPFDPALCIETAETSTAGVNISEVTTQSCIDESASTSQDLQYATEPRLQSWSSRRHLGSKRSLQNDTLRKQYLAEAKLKNVELSNELLQCQLEWGKKEHDLRVEALRLDIDMKRRKVE